MASGKTTLVKEFLKSKNLQDDVTSPTFSLQNIYSNNIFHYDFYNKSYEEFVALGMLEEFENSGVHFVEWADDKLEKILKEYGFKVVKISIEKLANKRRYSIES